MPPDRSSAEEYIEYPDREHTAESEGECEICGSTESLLEYSIDSTAETDSTSLLCPTHYKIAAILNGSRYPDPDNPPNYDLQETQKITVRVPRALVESADSIAEQQGQTRSEFVRDGIQMAIELQEIDEAFDEILSEAVQSPDETEPNTDQTEVDTDAETDTEFLKERIRTLESLLEDSIGKI
ncbi:MULTISPECIES: ribbon-helix-helix domain-containing protein [Natronorubrum]|uniref:Ribbon-helix-helix protein CopG domain-containing protein n=2 Tax=Natronorubrum bangense TaxID=61858 RepID=L9W908_9EURY|nr:ribbon-helix-helix protein, CopG family [Natronorubrum bangense]ELY45929.1 hypothetical protein C494_14958 [Natronorubrum bangense JCM 10635]QCC56622.1 ribbon-helix-helix protein, CopG family [Natronorubrum bangense]